MGGANSTGTMWAPRRFQVCLGAGKQGRYELQEKIPIRVYFPQKRNARYGLTPWDSSSFTEIRLEEGIQRRWGKAALMTHPATQWSFHEGSPSSPRTSVSGQPTRTVTRAHVGPKWKRAFATCICHDQDNSHWPSRWGTAGELSDAPRGTKEAPEQSQRLPREGVLFRPRRGLCPSMRLKRIPLKHGSPLASGGVPRGRGRTSSHPRRWQKTPPPAAKTARCSIKICLIYEFSATGVQMNRILLEQIECSRETSMLTVSLGAQPPGSQQIRGRGQSARQAAHTHLS